MNILKKIIDYYWNNLVQYSIKTNIGKHKILRSQWKTEILTLTFILKIVMLIVPTWMRRNSICSENGKCQHGI